MPEYAIDAVSVGKCYRLYERPKDRLRELLSPTRRTYHKEFWALQDFKLRVDRGECVGLVGMNGAGKSTALKILAGKLRPTRGHVETHGRLSSILELGTGFNGQLTGRQNAFVNALFMGLHPWEADRQVDAMLDFAELGEHGDQPLVTYSSGMQARLAFASLVTLDPEILILDEALATGDARFAAKSQAYLRKLCSSGCTTLIASHDVAFLEHACDRVVWLEHGKVRMEGPPSAVVPRYCTEALPRTSSAPRPRNVLLRLEARGTVRFFGAAWLNAAKQPLGHYLASEDAHWDTIFEVTSQLGFTPAAARKPWGATRPLKDGVYRDCKPAEGPGGAAYFGLPVPLPPIEMPSKLHVIYHCDAGDEVTLSLQLDTSWTELARTKHERASLEHLTVDMTAALAGTGPATTTELLSRELDAT